jgi:CRISPR-associated protein Cas1
MHSAVGFFHRARWGRSRLPVDILEEFRPVIVDVLVLRCLSTGIVRVEEFETTSDKGCRMNALARHAFLATSSGCTLTVSIYEPSGRRVFYRIDLSLHLTSLRVGQGDPQQPRRLQWPVWAAGEAIHARVTQRRPSGRPKFPSEDVASRSI